MQLEFYGAAGEVTGSCHILRVGAARVLLDCGLIQGGEDPDARNRADFPFEPATIDAVILSHAHIDHCGRLPLLYRRGFRGPVHATAACRDLARILLADSAAMLEREAERQNRRRERGGRHGPQVEPPFTRADADAVLGLFRTHRYDEPATIVPGIEVVYRDAGHILGSAGVWLTLREAGLERRVVFSGDVGQYDTPILRDPAGGGRADLVLVESTYGDRRHRERDATLSEFGEILLRAARDGGNVVIPAFAVGRSQELLYELGRHYAPWGLERWEVFLDSPMAIEASEVYWRHAELYDAEAAAVHARERMPALPNLRLTRSTEESMAINRLQSGAIIIAGSGMCTGGRIVHHLKHNLPRPECDVIFSGYQAVGTLGRAIIENRGHVRIHGEEHPVRARVHTLGGFSAHGDQEDLLRWISGIEGSPPVWLVHGETCASQALCERLRERGRSAEVARPGLVLDLAAA